ncbi:MAG: IclR family transcriptional regulator C-terminal domain-containing protein [Sedimenticolaceae bacterium]
MSKETNLAGVRAGRGGPSSGGKTTGQVQSLIRGLTILERLAAARDGDTLSDLAQGVGLAPSTTHRLLKSLEQMRFVSHDTQLGRWFIGVQAFTVGNSFLYHRDFVEVARPVMRRLMEESGETANLFVLDDGYAVTLSQVQCSEMMRMLARLGGRSPVHASAGGKALLALLPDDEVSAILHRRGLPKFTPNTIVTPARLRKELAEIRRRGYAIDDEEHAVGLRCVASAVYDEYGEPLAAISVSGPMARVSREGAAAMGHMVVQATLEVTAALGGIVPESRTRPGSAGG